jgi:hypothetical protein
MSAVEFLPESSEVSAPAHVIEWIAGVDADAPPPDPDALAAGGVLDGGTLHPRLEAIRAAIAGARIHLLLERGDRRGRGWLSPSGAVVAHPLADGRARLLMLPVSLIVDALVQLNDVGPRPRVEPAVRIVARPGELADALAARDAHRLRLEDPAQAEAFAALVAGLREHWRVAARWEPADGGLGGRDLEVLDTDGGYWLVVPDDPTVELWPATPTAVLRGLCNLFPPVTELPGWSR